MGACRASEKGWWILLGKNRRLPGLYWRHTMQGLNVAAQCNKLMKERPDVCFVWHTLGGRDDRRETVYVSQGRRPIKLAEPEIKAVKPAMEGILSPTSMFAAVASDANV